MYDMQNIAKLPRFGELSPEAFKAFVAFDQAAALWQRGLSDD